MTNLEKAGADNDDTPRKNFFKIMAMRSISIKNMKWEFCDMKHISFENIEDSSNKGISSTPQHTDSHPRTRLEGWDLEG